MMMAQDSKAGGRGLDARSLAELAAALENYIRDKKAEQLQKVLQRIAVEARERQMHAEDLLVSLKDVWYSLPGLREAGNPVEQTHLLQRVVSLCIREYYGGG